MTTPKRTQYNLRWFAKGTAYIVCGLLFACACVVIAPFAMVALVLHSIYEYNPG